MSAHRPRAISKEEWAAVAAEARSPAERAVLCALARYANRTNGVVKEQRAALAAASLMSRASFRTHVAALCARERGLVAATTLMTGDGDHDVTIYTLIGWLHLRGMSEPEHLRIGRDATAAAVEVCQNLAEGGANILAGGVPDTGTPGVLKSSTPGVIDFHPPQANFSTPHKNYAPARAESNLLKVLDNHSLSPSSRTPARDGETGAESAAAASIVAAVEELARGSSGGLRGDAGEVVALVNHAKLDPAKEPDLVVPAAAFIAGWKRDYGLTNLEIATVIRGVLDKRDKRSPGADLISTWKFFVQPIRRAAEAKRAAASPPALTETEVSHEQDRSNRPGRAPSNAAERERALAGDRRSSWSQALAERRRSADGG